MKSLISMMVLSICLIFASCSKAQVNDAKIAAAAKAGAGVEKALASEYVSAGIVVAGVDCAAEAKDEGALVQSKVLEVLKAETVVAGAATDKAFSAGSVLPPVCSFIVSSVLPQLIKDASSKQACLRALTSDKIVEVGNKLCAEINI